MSNTFDLDACRREISDWRNEGLRAALQIIAQPCSSLRSMRILTNHHDALLGILNKWGLLDAPEDQALDTPPNVGNFPQLVNMPAMTAAELDAAGPGEDDRKCGECLYERIEIVSLVNGVCPACGADYRGADNFDADVLVVDPTKKQP